MNADGSSRLLAQFRIPPEMVEAAGVRRASDAEVRELLGIHGRAGEDLSGIVFPCRDPRDGRVLGHRVRLHTKLADGQKYLSEQGCRALFFPPSCSSELLDTSVLVVFVESEKSALAVRALAQRYGRRVLCIATGGVWGWKRRKGMELTPDGGREPATGPSVSLDWVSWKGRKTVIAFDSNVAGRRDLEKARLAFSKELARRGAQVFIASVGLRGGVNGPDDLIAIFGDQATLGMLDRAAPFVQSKPTPIGSAEVWKPVSQFKGGFSLVALADLLSRPDLPVEYVVENLLVAGTVSCIVAKPKVGKSTFARNLCFRVSRGEEFLGLKTKKGECIYLALEEREEDIKNDFRALGATAEGKEPIYVHAAAAPAEGIHALCELVRKRRPILVVIDPLFRIARIRDEKAYAETYDALGPLIDVAREAGTHVLLTHHAGKSPKADAIDSPLGSTAIGGAVCTLLLLKRTESVRTVQTVQRIGKDLPETVLEFAAETHALSLGAQKAEVDVQSVATAILEYLQGVDAAKTEPEIGEAVEGKTGVKRKALRQLVDARKVDRDGAGRRGDPFRYRFSFSCSPDIPGTREQETEKRSETRVNAGDNLVPSSLSTSTPVPNKDGEASADVLEI